MVSMSSINRKDQAIRDVGLPANLNTNIDNSFRWHLE